MTDGNNGAQQGRTLDLNSFAGGSAGPPQPKARHPDPNRLYVFKEGFVQGLLTWLTTSPQRYAEIDPYVQGLRTAMPLEDYAEHLRQLKAEKQSPPAPPPTDPDPPPPDEGDKK